MTSVLTRTTTPSETPAKTPRRTRKQRGRFVRRAIWGGIAAVAGVTLVLAWRPKPVVVETVVAERGDLVVTVDEMAKTRVRDRYLVAAPIAGTVQRIELHPGDDVAAGSVLARIAPMQVPLLDPRSRAEAVARREGSTAGERQAEAAVLRAELGATRANQELERSRRLAASGSISEEALSNSELEARMRAQELASARFARQMAAHETSMAASALRRFDTTPSKDGFDVTSPTAGRVLKVIQQSGGPVTPGLPLVEVGDPSGLEIVADVLTADAVRMRPGARVTVERWGGPALRAHVKTVEPSAFTRVSALGVEEQRVAVVVDLDEPREAWAALGDGYRVEVRIVVAERHGVVRMPIGSAFRRGADWGAYVVRDGRAQAVKIELGERSEALVEVRAGVAEGDRVILHPGESVGDGTRVTTP